MGIRTVEVAETPYLYVAGAAPMDPVLIGKEMDKAFGRLMAFMKESGIAPGGAPMAVYHDYDPERMVFRAAIPVSEEDAGRATDDVEASVTPGGTVHTFTHIGPYSGLREAYAAVEAELARDGKSLGVPTWEVYANDPAETPESDLRTEVYSIAAERRAS